MNPKAAPPAMRATAAGISVATAWIFLAGILVALLLSRGIWVASIAYWAGCAVAIAAGPRFQWGARPSMPALVASAMAIAAGVAVAGVAVVILAAEHVDLRRAYETWQHWGLEGRTGRVWFACYVLCNPVLEEGYWRGTLSHPAFARRFGKRVIAFAAALGFAGHHAATLVASIGPVAGIVACLPIVAAGMVWRWMYRRTGGLWWPIATHAGVDLGLVLLWSLARPR